MRHPSRAMQFAGTNLARSLCALAPQALLQAPPPAAPGRRHRHWLRALAAAWPAVALAQSGPAVPDAGGLTRQIERVRIETPSAPPPASVLTAPPPPQPGAATVTVKAFALRGHTALATDLLQAALAPWLNTPLDFAGLRSATDRVAAAYQAHGRMATASLARQDVTDGVVGIDILEARFAGVRIAGRQPERVQPDHLLAMVAAQLRPGELLDTDAMNRALLLMDDLPGVAVSGSLASGRLPGDTELVLETVDEPAHSGRLQADNTGSRSVGEERLMAQWGWASPLGRGDEAQLMALATRGSQYARLGYSLPLGLRGARLQAWASQTAYRVVSPELAALDASGHSGSAGASLRWPLLRSRMVNVNTSLAAEAKRLHNSAGGTVSSHYKAHNWVAELSGNLFDDWGGGGANSAVVSMTEGRINLAGSPNEAADAQSAATAGRFRRWNLQLTRQQNLVADNTLYVALSAQQAGRNLDSSERMGLGGPSGVRAYPGNEASGSSGQLLNIELRHRHSDALVITGFYDLGRITVYAQANAPGGQSLLADAPNQYRLQGLGASATWQAHDKLQLQATLARRIGAHPSPTATGTDQDGSRRTDRLWLSASFTL